MKIVVLVKEVPDTYGDRKLSLETGLADRAATDTVLDEIGERALEVALSYADKTPGTEALPDPRMPNFKGIMAAKKKPFETLSLAELEIDPHETEASRSMVIALSDKPALEAGVKIVDEGDAGEKLAEFLVQNRLA